MKRVSIRAIVTCVVLWLSIAHPALPQCDSLFICIDPGHGYDKPGAIGRYKIGSQPDSVYEKDVNLGVAKFLRDTLRLLGASDPLREYMIVMTRTVDSNPTFIQRTNLSNQQHAGEPGDIFISVHHNAAADTSGNVDTTKQGTEVLWCSLSATIAGSDSGQSRRGVDSLAKRVYASLQSNFEGFGVRHTPVYVKCDLSIFQMSRTISCISEAQFLTYPPQARLYDLADSSHCKNEAHALAWGIKHFIGTDPDAGADPFVTIGTNITDSEVWFHVDDSTYQDVYYGNWICGENHSVDMPQNVSGRNFCRWNYGGGGASCYLSAGYNDEEWIANYSSGSWVWVDAPDGGDQFEEGKVVRIAFSFHAEVSHTIYVSVLLSRDGGVNWETLQNSKPTWVDYHGGGDQLY